MSIIIVGLGPAGIRSMTLEAFEIISSADTIYLRTSQHPAVDELPDHLRLINFDHIYEEADNFAEVYQGIASEVVELGRQADSRNRSVIYAVPGHPLVGETTTRLILEQALAESISVRIVDGMSFIEPTLTVLGIDGLDGLQIFDAVEVAGYHHPPINSDKPVLLGQLYNPMIASELKLSLMAIYPDDHEVTLVDGAGSDTPSSKTAKLYEIDWSQLTHLTSLYLPPIEQPGSLFSLAETVAILRGPEGCPWDQEQTAKSLRSGLLEEAAEVLTAIDSGDPQALAEELGDLLYHIIMQVQMASEEEYFRLTDVIGGIDSKLRRRHPHVWGDAEAADSEQVVKNWEDIKQQERDQPGSSLDNIPYALPALARSQVIQNRVKMVGFDWPTLDGVIKKVVEEMDELHMAGDENETISELGDVLFALVNWSRWLGIDAESALREANSRFETRFRKLEQLAKIRRFELEALELHDLEALWQEAKIMEGK